ncbi:unnamed protein product [Leptidea sinapis]|uniref:Mitochondrial dicarboxylate carrier n=1 Tax=Leptidea sinapis TaxID=189913 RepID=A0A5E4Q5Z9_9NEOP|nr:unnamed protein product [Leptidea sinapis]
MTETKVSHWYFGGLASAGAACVTHPLDLLKVQMQTQKGKNISMFKLTTIVLKNQGIMGLYNGISASLLRQMTYSTARFGIYEAAKQNLAPKDVTEEGVLRLWAGSSMACSRAVLMTIGQLSFYDSIKELLLSTPYFEDNVGTHVCSSLFAGGIATTMTQPADVLKTRAMNAKPGEFSGILHLMTSTAKEGPLAFFKGYIPAFVRLAPHTILTFVFLEQLRINFGFTKRDSN